jgi:hypothetical protein
MDEAERGVSQARVPSAHLEVGTGPRLAARGLEEAARTVGDRSAERGWRQREAPCVEGAWLAGAAARAAVEASTASERVEDRLELALERERGGAQCLARLSGSGGRRLGQPRPDGPE